MIDFSGMDAEALPNMENLKEQLHENREWILELAKFLRNSAITQLSGYDDMIEHKDDNELVFGGKTVHGKEIRPVNQIITTEDGRVIFKRSMMAKAVDDNGLKMFYVTRRLMQMDLTPFIDAVIYYEGDVTKVFQAFEKQKRLKG